MLHVLLGTSKLTMIAEPLEKGEHVSHVLNLICVAVCVHMFLHFQGLAEDIENEVVQITWPR